MASAFPVTQPESRESFADIRKRINSKFNWLHEEIDRRKNFLLSRLAELESAHERECKQQQTGLSSVLRVQSQVMEELRDNNLKYLQDSMLTNIQTQIEQMKVSVKLSNVYFEFDDRSVTDFICSIGSVRKVPNYKSKKHPIIVSSATHSANAYIPGEFYGPLTLSIEPNSGNIYIPCYDGLIHVFSPNAEFIHAIDSEISSTMDGRLAFSGNYFFISIHNDIRQYELNGTLIRTFPTQEQVQDTGIIILNSKLFFLLSENNHLVCFNIATLKSKSYQLEKYAALTSKASPVDIKPTPKGDLAILLSKTPFVVIFTFQGAIISKPLYDSRNLKSPRQFTIDSCGNFLICDEYIKIFQSNGDLLHTIGQDNPELISFSIGIGIDNLGRIVSLSGNTKNCLQIF